MASSTRFAAIMHQGERCKAFLEQSHWPLPMDCCPDVSPDQFLWRILHQRYVQSGKFFG